jgi:hypothetical protein
MNVAKFKVGDHVVRIDPQHRFANETGEIIGLEDNRHTVIGPYGKRYNYWVVRWPSQGRSPLRYRVDKAHELLRHAGGTLVHATRKTKAPKHRQPHAHATKRTPAAQLEREINEALTKKSGRKVR